MKSVSLANIDLNLIKVFSAIYEERNVTRAAKRLMMSQSGVSHALRNLRSLFNDPLFVRTPAGMIPTELSERIAIRVNFALNEMRDVLSVRSEFDPRTAEAQITIGLLSSPPRFVAELCRAIQDRAPGISLAFRILTAEAMPEAMDNRSVNLAVGAPDPDNMHDRRRFTYDELFGDDLVCVVGKHNPLVGDTLDIETYASLRHLAVAPTRFRKTWIDDVLTRHGLSRTISAMVPAPFFIGEILATTDLACIIMRHFVPRDAGLRLLPLPFPSKVHPFGQFSHARDDDNPLILWLRDVVRDVIAVCIDAGG